jgi:hypothetical protein
MRDWIVILILYVLLLGLFRGLGGFARAGEALRQWGERSGAARMTTNSTS